MQKIENKVDVVIDGKIISLKSSANTDHLAKVAMYVDQKIATLKAKNLTAITDERLRAVLIALNIGDDYFKATGTIQSLEAEGNQLAKALMAEEKRAKELETKLTKLEADHAKLAAEHQKLQKEFEEFIHHFDEKDGKDQKAKNK